MNNYGGVPDFRSSQDQEAGSDQPSHDPGGPLISELLWDKGPVPFAAQTPLFVPEGELSAWLSSPDDVTAAFAADSGLYPLPSGEGSLPPLPPPVPLRLCASEGSPMVQSAVTAAATAMAAPRLEERERERKRKAAPSCESDSRTSEDVEEGSDEKERSSSKSSRKTRSAEVHNSSERRRRDRINEKMKALRELLPRTSKLDKASMLDDAIEYTKSLQRQLQQMMSMGCTTFPMMYPAMQQYFPSMAAASIPMRADTGAGQLGHPMIPFFPGVQGSAPAGSASYSSMLAFQATYPYPTLFTGQQRAQGINFSNQVSDTTSSQCLNQPHLLNFPDSSYRQYFGHWHPNLQMPCENQEPTKTKTYEEKELPGNSNG